MGKRSPPRLEVGLSELKAILDRARGTLDAEDYSKLASAVETLAFLTRELETKGTTISRLRRLLFGPSTEKTSRVLKQVVAADSTRRGAKRDRRPGHGRNGVAAYRGAEKIAVAHPSLRHGQACPCCRKGKIYRQAEPASLLRIRGMAPLQASVYELERLRCGTCGEVFSSPAPEGVGNQKYDETASAMVALLKYGAGMPFYRLEKLQAAMGIPLPAATQWEIVRDAAGQLQPAYAELIRQAAQGLVVHNDDTAMKILSLERADPPEPRGSKERSGVFTSGIVSSTESRQMAVFFTGRKHAGENLTALLAQRQTELSAPIQMCDALSRNEPKGFDTILANCLAHARRQFVDVAGSFPEECRYVLESLRQVYHHDETARKMGPAERLAFHQQHSGPVMKDLEEWLCAQIQEKTVEPNSGLGQAIAYMHKHWKKLTLFLRRPGAPLDNTICERALKRVILHRKNALFYKTELGARVGDLFMSLIHTAELNRADPFDYLVTLQRRIRDVQRKPQDWMPWNYRATLANQPGAPRSPG